MKLQFRKYYYFMIQPPSNKRRINIWKVKLKRCKEINLKVQAERKKANIHASHRGSDRANRQTFRDGGHSGKRIYSIHYFTLRFHFHDGCNTLLPETPLSARFPSPAVRVLRFYRSRVFVVLFPFFFRIDQFIIFFLIGTRARAQHDVSSRGVMCFFIFSSLCE